MTSNQVKNLIFLIQAYFPTIKIADNPVEILVWEDEFANLDNDLVVEATKTVCRQSDSGFVVTIGAIKTECARIMKEIEDSAIKENPNSIPMPDNVKEELRKAGLI